MGNGAPITQAFKVQLVNTQLFSFCDSPSETVVDAS